MEVVNRQLKKGFLDILLLELLSGKPMYGYELMAELDGRSGGYFQLREGTLYPVLYRLEDAGHIGSLWETENDSGRRGVPRKYYTITEGGSAYLAEARKEIKLLIGAIGSIMGGDLV